MGLDLAANALVTPEEYLLWAGRDVSDADQKERDRIVLAINDASDRIEKHCRRVFKRATIADEPYDGTGTRMLRLRRPPVTEVTSVKIVDVLGTVTVLDATAYQLDRTVREPRALFLSTISDYPAPFGFYTWPAGRGNILVSNTGGYETIPGSVKLGCFYAMAKELFASGLDPSIARESGGGYARDRNAIDPRSGLPQDAVTVLQSYRILLISSPRVSDVESEAFT